MGKSEARRTTERLNQSVDDETADECAAGVGDVPVSVSAAVGAIADQGRSSRCARPPRSQARPRSTFDRDTTDTRSASLSLENSVSPAKLDVHHPGASLPSSPSRGEASSEEVRKRNGHLSTSMGPSVFYF
jgi:hypothetical protein